MSTATVKPATGYFSLLDDVGETGDPVFVTAGRYVFSAGGTFDGETVTLQRQIADATYLSVGVEAELTTSGQCQVALSAGFVKVAVSTGGGTPSGLYADLKQID